MRSNVNPTPRQFQESFFTLLVNNMQCISMRRGNCEIINDNFNILCTFETYLELKDGCSIICNNDKASEFITDRNVAEEFIVASSADYQNKIIKLILKEVNFCINCKNTLKDNSFLCLMKQVTSITNRDFRFR